MTGPQLAAVLPLLVTAATAIAVMLAVAVRRSHAVSATIALAGLACSLAAAAAGARAGAAQDVGHLLRMDAYAAVYMALSAGGSLAAGMLAYRGLACRTSQPEEFYILLPLATLGSQVLACSVHFASLLLGLELLAMPLYALIAYRRRSAEAIEAGIKYLVLASVSTALLVFGMALLYAQTGSLGLEGLAAAGRQGADALFAAGAALVLVGLAFKLSLAPLHLWAPDVYQGAMAPVGGLLATVSKGGVFALLLRYAIRLDLGAMPALWALLYAVAVATMFAGNALALRQTNLKRLLGCSSIAHLGYLLVPLLAGGPLAAEAATFYLLAYYVTALAAFGVVAVLTGPAGEPVRLADYRALAWRRPMPAAALTVAMLSLAGMPLTAGFMAKFYAVLAGVGAGLWPLVLVLAANSVIGLFYYLRVVVALYAPPDELPDGAEGRARTAGPPGLLAPLAVGALTAGTIGLGVLPGPLAVAIQSAVRSLF